MGAAAITRQLRLMREALAAAGGGGASKDSSLWKAPYGSLITAVQDPALCVVRSGLAGSTMYLSRVYLPEGPPVTISEIQSIVTTAGSGLTFVELGIFDHDYELIAKTGDVKASYQSGSGPKPHPLNVQAGKSLTLDPAVHPWVLAAITQVGTTRASLGGYALSSLVAGIDGQPPRAFSSGSVSAIPDTLDPPFAANSANLIWFGLA